MSIALSADILPSRLLRAALCACALAHAGAALALAAAPQRVHGPLALVAACLLAAGAAGRAAAQRGTTRRIDISGLGALRLTVQQSLAQAPGAPLQLMPASTLWPRLMLLLLRDGNSGALTVLAILPDSVSPEQSRKLAVALRAIAGRDKIFFGKHKIH